jgi:hypothetical protein
MWGSAVFSLLQTADPHIAALLGMTARESVHRAERLPAGLTLALNANAAAGQDRLSRDPPRIV